MSSSPKVPVAERKKVIRVVKKVKGGGHQLNSATAGEREGLLCCFLCNHFTLNLIM